MSSLYRAGCWVCRQFMTAVHYFWNHDFRQDPWVRLIPVMQKTTEQGFGMARDLSSYPKRLIEKDFRKLVAEPPTFLRLVERRAWGFLKVSPDGVEDPNTIPVAFWHIYANGVKAGIIFFEDDYYAVDTCNDDPPYPQWITKPGYRKGNTRLFNIRIYWKVQC